MASTQEYLYDLVTGKIKSPQGAFLRGCLFILSLVYGVAVRILAGFYRIKPARLGAKVISVGNITLGGTGKTTLVEYLSVKLSSAGQRIAVLSRGYKRTPGSGGAQGLGDEPAMLKKKLPQVAVVVDPDRIKAARAALSNHAYDIFILDDGFQQWKIFKDLEIVTIDAANPFGNGRLLPAGFLREPLSALKRADIFLLTQGAAGQDREFLTQRLRRINPQALIVESRHEPAGFLRLDQENEILSPESFKGKPVAIFCGIGNPEGFKHSIDNLGIKVARSFRFADHHQYTCPEITQIIKAAREANLEAIITTQKDAVKVRELGINDPLIFVLDITLSITKNEAEFDRRLLKLYSL